MACCSRSSSAEAKKDKEIGKFLQNEKQQFDSEIKLLLLGAGESGKSTIAKQMKIIHLDGFPEKERLSYKTIIYSNVFLSLHALINATKDMNIPLTSESATAAARFADEPSLVESLSPEIAKDIKCLWSDPGIRKAYERQNEFQLNDSAEYYLNAIDRLAAPDYIPTEQDVLRSRAKTTGVIETEFVVGKIKFRMVDVGGQRSERKKWMHCFQDVTAVIFCVAVSEYDLKLNEDDQVNRMHESLKLFQEICNSKWFLDTSMILFFNKNDLFTEKIKKVDLKVCFPEYTGGCNYDQAIAFIKEKFTSLNENPKKQIYTHVTCAMDTHNMEVVFGVVKEIILRKVLSENLGAI